MMSISFDEWLGFTAAALTTAAFVPQAWLTFRTRDVSGISLAMYSVFTLGIVLWLVYGIRLGKALSPTLGLEFQLGTGSGSFDALSGGTTIGPLLMGMERPVQIVPMDASVSQMVDMACLAAYQAAPR